MSRRRQAKKKLAKQIPQIKIMLENTQKYLQQQPKVEYSVLTFIPAELKKKEDNS